MKGIPDFTPSGALGDGATSCPYHSTRVPGYPRPERATGSQKDRARERYRRGRNYVDICSLYTFIRACVEIYSQVTSLSHEKTDSLACLSVPRIYSLTPLRDRDEPGLQNARKTVHPKHLGNSVKFGNIMDHNSGPACNHFVTLPSLKKKIVQSKISFYFSVKLPIKLSFNRTQTPILNASAITLVWCTAVGHNFP